MARNGMTCSEAGRLGAKASVETLAQQKNDRISKYNENPSRCAYCNNPLSYEHRRNKYCNSSCAAKHLNPTKSKKPPKLCLNCGAELSNRHSVYCCMDCEHQYHWKQTKDAISNLGQFPYDKRLNDTNRRIVKRYLEETVGHKCAICGSEIWNNQPIPLVTDHIDGDSTNHSVNNLRLICPNCDAQTETYKSRGGRTSTRTWRKQYYKSVNLKES